MPFVRINDYKPSPELLAAANLNQEPQHAQFNDLQNATGSPVVMTAVRKRAASAVPKKHKLLLPLGILAAILFLSHSKI